MIRGLFRLMLALFLISFFLSDANAQSLWGQGKMSWGVGAQLSFPAGNLSDVASVGFGGFGKFQYGLNNEWMLTGSLGYTYWTNKDWNGLNNNAYAVPLLVGTKFNLAKEVTPGLYGLGEVGFYFLTMKSEYGLLLANGSFSPTGQYDTVSETELALCLGIGYQFQDFDISAKYAIAGDASNFAISGSYQLPLQ